MLITDDNGESLESRFGVRHLHQSPPEKLKERNGQKPCNGSLRLSGMDSPWRGRLVACIGRHPDAFAHQSGHLGGLDTPIHAQNSPERDARVGYKSRYKT